MVEYETPMEICEQRWLGLAFAVIESAYAENDVEFINNDYGIYGQILNSIVFDKDVQAHLKDVQTNYANRRNFAELMKGLQL